MATERAGEFGSPREAAAALLRAWRDQLGAPDRGDISIDVRQETLVVSRTDARGPHIVGQVPRSEKASSDLAGLLGHAAGRKGPDVTLRLDPAQVLKPVLQMPGGSQRTLERALAYEIERLTPIDPKELYFDFVVRREPRARQAEVTLRAVQKPMLDEVVLMAHSAGARVAGIVFGDDEIEADRTSFPVDRAAWLRAEWRRRGNLALGILAAVLFIAVIGAAALRGERSIDALNARVEVAATRAAAVERTERRVATASARLSWLLRERQAPLLAKTLADFSRVLPDGTWLRELNVDGATIHASGFSKDASALIGVFDRSVLFKNAQFSAPVVRNPADGTDRFELTVDLADRSAR